MPRSLIRPFLIVACTLAAGCAARHVGGPAVPGGSEVRRAALARVIVENRTEQRLAIAFRPAGSPGHEVIVGAVAGNDTATVAPVLAGEPIILLARAASGAELRLPARSLDIDEEWHWVIPGDAAFEPPSREASSE